MTETHRLLFGYKKSVLINKVIVLIFFKYIILFIFFFKRK